MPITTGETHSAGSSDVSKGDLSKGADSSRAGAAAGVEVPVIVHASRYSSSANSVGKTLPPVHEETRTVIVFEQGAVVRLSAAVTTGEVVVLTNKLTGADVICKVANVKAQPGIQNYVSLEFTQRAPGFWGESSQISRAPQAPAVELGPSVIAPPALTSRPVETAPPAKPSPAVTIPDEPTPAPPNTTPPPPTVASYEHEHVAPGIAESISSLPAAPASATSPAKIFEAGSTLGLRQSGSAAVNQRPIELAIPSQSPTHESKNVVLMAVAAVVLVCAGGLGAWLLLRPSHQAAPPSDVASVPQQAPAVTAGAAPQSGTPATAPDAALSASAQAEPEVAPSTAALRSEIGSGPHTEGAAVQPAVAKSGSQSPAAASASAPSAAPTSAATAPVTETSHRPVLDIGKMAAPSVKNRKLSSSTSSEAPPELLAQSEPSAGGSLNDSLLSTSARGSGPSAPFSSEPTKGGQMLQPKLISSPAALYPAEARTAQIQGDVAIDAFIDESGRVVATKVISGPPILQQTAMNAVRSWKYQPARLDGQPVSIHIRVDVNFRIQ